MYLQTLLHTDEYKSSVLMRWFLLVSSTNWQVVFDSLNRGVDGHAHHTKYALVHLTHLTMIEIIVLQERVTA